MSVQAKYILTERIAQGGMAEIHLGKIVGADGFAKACAFKRILPQFASDADFVQMFHQEAMVAKQLQHKNIVQVHDFVQDGPSFMLVMEYVDGQDLRSVLRAAEQAKKRIPIEIACFMAKEMLTGLQYAHTASDVAGHGLGIVHRDISPQNVLVSYEGDVKITDFGIAKVQSQSSNTRAGVIKGKFAYMSPEQAQGLNLDARTDVFAVGIILYEMLTMTRLFKGEDLQVLQMVRDCKIKPPNQVRDAKIIPDELEVLVMKFLTKDLNKRYLSAKDAIKDLTRFIFTFKPDFVDGELAEFMQLLFQDKLVSARERIRSTLALPDSVVGLGGLRDSTIDPNNPFSGSGGELSNNNGPRAVHSPNGIVHSQHPMGNHGDHGSAYPHGSGRGAMGIAAQSHALVGRSLGGQSNPPGDQNVRLVVVGGKGMMSSNHAAPQAPYQQGGQKRRSATSGTNVRYVPNQNREGSGKRTSILGAMMGILGALLVVVGGVALVRFKVIALNSDLEISTAPAGRVQIEVNGQKFFKGDFVSPPFNLKLEPGNHQIAILRPGFKPSYLSYQAAFLGSKEKRSTVLEPDGVLGQIKINTLPSGAKVTMVQTKDSGTSPVTFEYLPIGLPIKMRIEHPKCPPAIIVETLPSNAAWQIYQKTFQLRGCK